MNYREQKELLRIEAMRTNKVQDHQVKSTQQREHKKKPRDTSIGIVRIILLSYRQTAIAKEKAFDKLNCIRENMGRLTAKYGDVSTKSGRMHDLSDLIVAHEEQREQASTLLDS